MEIKQHTVKSYDKDLDSISKNLYDMFYLLSESIKIVEDAIKNPEKNFVTKIKDNDNQINTKDHLTEQKVTSMLALRQPLAFDLRYIISSLKVSSNLERMGDKCKTIINKLSYLEVFIDEKTKVSLLKMLEIAKEMAKNAVFAYNENDTEKAEQVLEQDDQIDNIYQQLFSIAEGDSFDRQQVKNIINVLFIAKSFERLADHAANIAQMVNYVISGEIKDCK